MCLCWECVRIEIIFVLLVPQAPPYSAVEAWTMYWNLQAAVETAEFAKEDVEFYKKDRDDAYNELRHVSVITDTNVPSKSSS